MLGVSPVASADQTGKPVPSPKFPFRVVFHPLTKWHKAFPDTYPGIGFQEQLIKTLTTGPVFDVYAQDSPLDDPASVFKIGTISLNGPVTTSNFGDLNYFIEHTRWEDDAVFRPEWTQGAIMVQKKQRAAPAPGYSYPDLPWV